MTEQEKITDEPEVIIPRAKCLRCGYVWMVRVPRLPAVCPRCISRKVEWAD